MQKIKKLLDKSIRHWEENLKLAEDGKLTRVDIHGHNCPVCVEYASEGCTGCPIMENTGEPDCEGTPWVDVHAGMHVNDYERIWEATQRELDYLIKLRATYDED